MAGDSFTVFWASHRVRALEQLPRKSPPFSLLFGGPHVSQPSFKKAGAKPGDWVYPITVDKGRLSLLGRMCVSSIEPSEAPKSSSDFKKLRSATLSNLHDLGWPHEIALRTICVSCVEEIVHGEQGSGPLEELYLDKAVVSQLRYLNRKGERVPSGIAGGLIKSSLSLQGIYRLAPKSAAALERAVTAYASSTRSRSAS